MASPRLTALATALACPICGARIRASTAGWRCRSGHEHPVQNGIADLTGGAPDESTGSTFDGLYGTVYDFGIRQRGLAERAGRLFWGTNLRPMFALMDRGARMAAGMVVVDVPCGSAPVLDGVARVKGTYIGIDMSMAMLERAAARTSTMPGSITFVRGDATALPLGDASVDRILCFNGLHVIPDKAQVLREFARVLRPGGEILGSVLARPRTMGERLRRPWTSRAAWFFHPADAEVLPGLAREAGFSRWSQRQDGPMVLIRGHR